MSGDGCVVGVCAGIPGPIAVEAVGDIRLGVDLPFQALERQALLVGCRRMRAGFWGAGAEPDHGGGDRGSAAGEVVELGSPAEALAELARDD